MFFENEMQNYISIRRGKEFLPGGVHCLYAK
jgi:hypothetical protein